MDNGQNYGRAISIAKEKCFQCWKADTALTNCPNSLPTMSKYCSEFNPLIHRRKLMFINTTMTKKVMTVSKETSVLEVSELMKKNSIRHLPIVDKDNILLGIITDRDVRSAMPSILLDYDSHKERERIEKITVGEIMTKNPITISPMNTLEDALVLMQQTKVGAVSGSG